MFLEKDHHCVVAWGRCEEDDNIVQGRWCSLNNIITFP